MKYEWLPRAIEWLEMWGADRELIEAAVEHPTQITDDPKSAEYDYPVKRHRRGDLEVSVGFREPEHPTILYIHLHLPLDDTGGSRTPAGGSGTKPPKGLREFKQRVWDCGYKPTLRNGHVHILRPDGSFMMSTSSTPSDYNSIKNAWSSFQKLASADAVQAKLQELKSQLDAEGARAVAEPECNCRYDDYAPHRRKRNPQCPEHGLRDTAVFVRLSAGGTTPQGYEGWWQCPHCGDIYGPEDEDRPPVCEMCLKAGRT